MEYTSEQIIENRRIWEKALESGDYEKGTSVLRSKDDKYCCLGVACELFDNENTVIIDDSYYVYGESQYGAFATENVVAALGLYSINACIRDGEKSLSTINDLNDSFQPVIDAIKTGNYYKKLD